MNQNQTVRCSNCAAEFDSRLYHCPTCGMRRPGATDQNPGMTPYPWLDGFLGCLASLGLSATGIGAVVAIILIFIFKERYRSFASGLGIGCALALLLFLGLLAACFLTGIRYTS